MSDTIHVSVHAERTSAEFKMARRTLRAQAARGMREQAQRALLPPVKRAAPAVVAHYFTTKARVSGSVFITTLGPKMQDRIAGLLNFGGLVSTKIVPKRKEALRFRGSGVFVSRVGNGQRARGRKYRGKHFIERGVVEGYPQFEHGVTDAILRSFGELADA
jgi:S1-C subfamily serine protease